MATSANRHIQNHRRQESTISVKTFLISIAVSILVILSLWAWKSIERKSIIQKSQRQSQFYKNKISAKLDASLKNQLLVFSKPLFWAIRTELLKGDRKAVNTYLNQLMTMENLQEASVIDNYGIIIASSKKSEIGHLYSTFYNISFLSTDSARLNIQSGNSFIITSPIYGRDRRLAILSIHYQLANIDQDFK
ncbi:hypothetical protein EA772_15560 [Pedobacter sp. G11]|uniref:hypothetical protein n=1 Tax=Pedobacter sp. G11 TaxID=2482728 RepID=UPI000F5F5924|nr:hypothetical protein [Pedobacter sp. G11]AZI26690.1 hypothetical protein EA772_15560 [Pedobacter sp. G11]